MSQKKYMVRCDLEGVSGVVSYAQVEPGKPEYSETRANFMSETLALIDGLKSGGAEHIEIYDEHWFGRNLDVARLPKDIVAYCGKPPYRKDWAGGLDASFAGLILHGFHSRAGTGQLLHHTYEPDIAHIDLNGVDVGEIGMEAAIAGDFGVPLLLITADSGGVEEAQKFFPKIASVITKESFSPDGAACYSLDATLEKIRASAENIVKCAPEVSPFRFNAPITLTIDFNEGAFLSMLHSQAKDLFKNPRQIVLRDYPTVTSAWADYWKLKIKAQEAIAYAHAKH